MLRNSTSQYFIIIYLQNIKRAHEACGDTRLGEKVSNKVSLIWRRGRRFVFNLNTSMLQVKKQEKMIKKLRRLVEEKARRLTKYEIRGDESEEEEDDISSSAAGEYVEDD